MEKIFADKVAIITGASFGIGQATAIAFAARGAKVAIVDWVEDQETLHQIHAIQGEAIFIKCDVSQATQVQAMVQQVINTYGRIDFAFNNAGIEGVTAQIPECTEDNWNKTIGVNLTGVWLCMKYEIAQMLRQGKGVIVNCASVAGLIAAT